MILPNRATCDCRLALWHPRHSRCWLGNGRSRARGLARIRGPCGCNRLIIRWEIVVIHVVDRPGTRVCWRWLYDRRDDHRLVWNRLRCQFRARCGKRQRFSNSGADIRLPCGSIGQANSCALVGRNDQGNGWRSWLCQNPLGSRNRFCNDCRNKALIAAFLRMCIKPVDPLGKHRLALFFWQFGGHLQRHLGIFTHFFDQRRVWRTTGSIHLCQFLHATFYLGKIPLDRITDESCHDTLHFFTAALNRIERVSRQGDRCRLQHKHRNEHDGCRRSHGRGCQPV